MWIICLSLLISGVMIIAINIVWWFLCHFLYHIFTEFLFSHDLENILLIYYIEFIAKYLHSYLPIIICMCYYILSSEIIFLDNEKFQSNVLLFPNTKSASFFAYICILIFLYYIFVLVGIVVLLFLGGNWTIPYLSWYLFRFCDLLNIFVIYPEFLLLLMKWFLFVKTVEQFFIYIIFLFIGIWLFIYYLLILYYIRRVRYLFIAIYVWELNSSILITQISWIFFFFITREGDEYPDLFFLNVIWPAKME